MPETDSIARIKAEVAFNGLFKEFYPKNYNPNGNSRCPQASAHTNADDSPSFQVEKDHGFCHAGCKPPGNSKAWDIFSLWQFRYGCDFKSAHKALSKRCGLGTKKRTKGRIIETYPYFDEKGTLLYEVCRLDPKGDFPQRRPDPKRPGNWIWKLGNTCRVLYRLPEVLRADRTWICEGEKDASNLAELSLCGTTSPQGAGKWMSLVDKYRIHEPLKGKTVYILPDNDKQGRKHAEDIARSLVGFAARIKILYLPGLPEKGDVSDFIQTHGPEEAKRLLLELAEEAPEFQPDQAARMDVGPPNLTDMGNSKRLARLYGDLIRFCKALGWLIYDGKRWVTDDLAQVQRFAKETVCNIFAEAAKEVDEERRKCLASFALKCESAPRIQAMIQLLPSEPGISVPHEVFDQDKMLFNLLDGTLDLRSGKLRPHSPTDLITKLAPVAFDADAPCPRWQEFVSEIMCGDLELASFIQRLVGYIMTGLTNEQVWSFFYGRGANGKSTFLSVLSHVLGNYSVNTPAETFMETQYSSIRNDLARLRGARLVTAAEPKGKNFDAAVLKSFTGQDLVTCRFLHHEYFEFVPEGKLIFSANQKPVVKDPTDGFWRRMLLVPFKRQFKDASAGRDDGLKDKLFAEAAGILNWAIQGCLEWQKAGLRPPSIILEAVSEYRTDTDILSDFLEANCVMMPPAKVAVSALYDSYLDFCEAKHKRKPLSNHGFNENLLSRPDISRKRLGPQRVPTWLGIGLKASEAAQTGRTCHSCDLMGRPCPKAAQERDPATCQYYRTSQ